MNNSAFIIVKKKVGNATNELTHILPFICGATKQKQSLRCMQFTVKVCYLPHQIAHFHSELHTPK